MPEFMITMLMKISSCLPQLGSKYRGYTNSKACRFFTTLIVRSVFLYSPFWITGRIAWRRDFQTSSSPKIRFCSSLEAERSMRKFFIKRTVFINPVMYTLFLNNNIAFPAKAEYFIFLLILGWNYSCEYSSIMAYDTSVFVCIWWLDGVFELTCRQ